MIFSLNKTTTPELVPGFDLHIILVHFLIQAQSAEAATVRRRFVGAPHHSNDDLDL